jgi:hypothetical protein
MFDSNFNYNLIFECGFKKKKLTYLSYFKVYKKYILTWYNLKLSVITLCQFTLI